MASGKVVIHACWDDSDDEELKEYASTHSREVEYLDSYEILERDPSSIDALFCNTDTFQRVVPHYQPPPTYPEGFHHLYKRDIKISTIKEVIEHPLPVFVKPVSNNKAFTGLVVRDFLDLEVIKSSGLDSFYTSNVVNYVSEFRLFIGEKKLRGCVESTYYVLGRDATNSPPPQEFIEEVLAANTHNYVVVDVGLVEGEEGVREWNVVEANPPFALSSYGWDIAEYYEYCRDAWYSIRG